MTDDSRSGGDRGGRGAGGGRDRRDGGGKSYGGKGGGGFMGPRAGGGRRGGKPFGGGSGDKPWRSKGYRDRPQGAGGGTGEDRPRRSAGFRDRPGGSERSGGEGRSGGAKPWQREGRGEGRSGGERGGPGGGRREARGEWQDRSGGGVDRKPRFGKGPREGGDRSGFGKGRPGGDKPWRSGGYRDRPQTERGEGGGAAGGDRPRRPYRERSAEGGGGGERPARPWRERSGEGGGGDRPRRPYRERSAEGGGGERPARPWRERSGEGGGGDRPRRPYRERSAAGDGEIRRPRPEAEGGEPSHDAGGVHADAGTQDGGSESRAPRGDRPFVKRPWKDRGEGERSGGGYRSRDRGEGRGGDREERGPRREGGFKRPFRDGGGKRDFKGGKGDFKRGPKEGGRGGFKDKGKGGEAPFGLGARQQAVDLILAVLSRRRSLDDALAELDRPGPRGADKPKLAPRDRAFARMMAATVLRRLGQIDAVIDAFLERPLPPEAVELRAILQCATAQMLFIGTAPHAAINIAVDQARAGEETARFDGLTNAILRRVSKEGPELVAQQDATALNMPAWLMARWTATYAEETAKLLAEASLKEAPLDLSVKSDAEGWAQKLGGRVLPTGTVRIAAGGRVEDLEGYADGEWWVQDAAAALPAKLLGDVAGLQVADLCAAPGGKTVELAAMGAKVTAVEVSWLRIDRIRQNLARMKLTAEAVQADVLKWAPTEAFDAVLLDAPCTATGTIRRHPDLLRLKRTEDVAKLAGVQTDLLRAASALVKPGGRLVYCTCSLEPEEGEHQIGKFLAASQMFELVPVDAAALGWPAEWVTAKGYLRTMPHLLPLDPPEMSGIDGFFAACLRRLG